jgi:hypothetical protein
MNPSRAELERFFAKLTVNRITGCWLWKACLNGSGYGMFNASGAGRSAHVVAFEWFVGQIPFGREVDHLCCHKRCVNPAHLEAVTKRENFERWHRTVTHCKRGHEFTPENTRVWSSGGGKVSRYCLTCRRTGNRARRERAA